MDPSAVRNADKRRLSALAALFKRHGHDGMSADVRSRTIYLLQVGYISMQTVEPMALRMSRMAIYIEIFTGIVPERRELDRFFARHGFKP